MASLTYSDIETRVANQLRIPTTNTTEMAKIKAVINEVYRDIAAKQDWQWLLKRSVINVTPKIEDDAASLTLGSTVGLLSSAPQQNSANVAIGGFILNAVAASDDTLALYRVTSTHTAGSTAFALDAAFTNATSTSQSIRLYQDSYALPSDCGKVLHVKRFGRPLPLRRMGIEELSQLKLVDRTEGAPEAYSVFDYETTGDPTSLRMLQIHPFPDNDYHRLEVFYKQNLNTELTGATRPHIPDDYVQVLIYGALARCYPIFMNDLDRGRFFQQLFNDVMALMSAQQREYASDKSGIAPDASYRRRRMPLTGYSMGSFFDTWPNIP